MNRRNFIALLGLAPLAGLFRFIPWGRNVVRVPTDCPTLARAVEICRPGGVIIFEPGHQEVITEPTSCCGTFTITGLPFPEQWREP